MHIDLHTQRDFDPPCECSIAVEPTNDGALWFYIQYCDKHSAASEMYEALCGCRISLIGDEHYQEFKPLLEVINAAIAKADGGKL